MMWQAATLRQTGGILPQAAAEAMAEFAPDYNFSLKHTDKKGTELTLQCKIKQTKRNRCCP
jgi:hypothetical protein